MRWHLSDHARRFARPLLLPLAVALTAFAGGAHAQPGSAATDWPAKPIKLVVPFSPGGPNDVAARVIAPALSARLKQPVVVHNVAGAGGRIGMKAAAVAAADGYTLMIGGTNLNVVIPAVYRKLDFDPVNDLVPVGAVATDAMLLAVHPSIPAGSVAEFVQYSRRQPGKVSGGSAPGIGPHFVIEMFKRRTAADITFVPYKGAAPAIQDALGGHLSLTATNKAVLLPLIQKGQLRALAVTSAQRLPELPEVPTLAESGVTGVPSLNWYGVFAPARTPAAVVDRVRAALKDLGRDSAVLDGIRRLGLDPALNEPDFGAQLAAQRRQWDEVVRETGISLD